MSKYGFGTKEEILAQLEAFKRINALDEARPVQLTPQGALAAIASLYRLMPAEARNCQDDPSKRGARTMIETLAKLRG